jgi:hypothetical protein
MTHSPEPESSAPDLLRPPDPATSRRLFQLGCLGLGLALVALVHQSPIKDPILLTLGSAVLLLGAVPALNWARRGDAHFPVFEVFMLAGIPFYGISLLAGHPEVLTFSEGATLQAAAAILIYQACAIVAFFWTTGQPVRSALWSGTLLPSSTLRYAQTGLWLNTGYLYVNGFTDWIPGELRIVTRAVFFGIGTVALFIEMRRWGDRRLALVAGISLALLALLAYVSSSRKIPLAVMVVVFPILAVLHNGKSSMRYEYWEQRAPLPTVTELPGFFEKWIHYGLSQRESGDEPSSSTLAGRLFERASLFQMLCLVTERTPDFQPYLAGESYLQIPAQLIPSFLWPGKPSSLLSNVMLAIHFRLVPEDNPTSVSIAFGMVAEAYANFGFAGCAGLGLLLGYLYKRVTAAATGSAQFSALGLLTILLAAWSFQSEQIFATWLVSLIQAAGVVIGVPLGLRLVFRSA